MPSSRYSSDGLAIPPGKAQSWGFNGIKSQDFSQEYLFLRIIDLVPLLYGSTCGEHIALSTPFMLPAKVSDALMEPC